MAEMQQFASGATRNDDSGKYDYEGFINPEALHAYGEYMHEHRTQRDGSIRDSDNWQKGIPFRKYVKSLVRHSIDLWRMDRGYAVTNPDTGKPHTKKELCCAIIFNAMGYLKEMIEPAGENAVARSSVVGSSPRRPEGAELGCKAYGNGDESSFKWACERQAGHSGDHMAWDDYETRTLYAGGRWPNEKGTQSNDTPRIVDETGDITPRLKVYVSSHAGKV